MDSRLDLPVLAMAYRLEALALCRRQWLLHRERVMSRSLDRGASPGHMFLDESHDNAYLSISPSPAVWHVVEAQYLLVTDSMF